MYSKDSHDEFATPDFHADLNVYNLCSTICGCPKTWDHKEMGVQLKTIFLLRIWQRSLFMAALVSSSLVLNRNLQYLLIIEGS